MEDASPSPLSLPQMRCVDHFIVTYSHIPRPITLFDPITLAAPRKGYRPSAAYIHVYPHSVFRVRVEVAGFFNWESGAY
jgi:hypothetical protein